MPERGVFLPLPGFDPDPGSSPTAAFWTTDSFFVAPGTYSVPSTLHVRRSFHSSPASLSYRSLIVQSSKFRPITVFEVCELKKSLKGLLPPRDMRWTSAFLKASMVTLRTKEMCTPRERWMPEQARQKKMPSLGEACETFRGQFNHATSGHGIWEERRHTHCGLGAPQSMHRLFSLTLEISWSLDRVSGSTSHILLILAVSEVSCYPLEGLWWCY